MLARIAATLRPGDAFLVSADLINAASVFETCYNDPPGHTAFADFRLNHLDHLARRDQRIALPGLGLDLDLPRGDGINVGFSAKFDPDRLCGDVAARRCAVVVKSTETVDLAGLAVGRVGRGRRPDRPSRRRDCRLPGQDVGRRRPVYPESRRVPVGHGRPHRPGVGRASAVRARSPTSVDARFVASPSACARGSG